MVPNINTDIQFKLKNIHLIDFEMYLLLIFTFLSYTVHIIMFYNYFIAENGRVKFHVEHEFEVRPILKLHYIQGSSLLS